MSEWEENRTQTSGAETGRGAESASAVTYETILGVRVGNFTYDRLLAEVDRVMVQERQAMIVAINPEKVVKAQTDEALKELLNEAEMPIADGIGVVLASRWWGGKVRERVTGVETMLHLCRHAAARGYPVFLLGAKPGVAERPPASCSPVILDYRWPGRSTVISTMTGKWWSRSTAPAPESCLSLWAAPGRNTGFGNTATIWRPAFCKAWAAVWTSFAATFPGRRNGCSGWDWSGCIV